MPDGLPLLDGPDARVADVVALYNESRALFPPSGIGVRGVTLDRRGSWTLDAVERHPGRWSAAARRACAWRRFARLLPQLLSQKQLPLTRADLRYTNGFALSWPASPAPAAAVAPQLQGKT